MKTQQELMQAYWGPGGTVDMVKEYNARHGCDVKPWECVRMTYNGSRTQQGRDHPYFDCDNKAIYAFALTILYDDKRKEHRPVFVGDRLWLNNMGMFLEVTGKVKITPRGYSWNPPTLKRTFKLNDMELPCPTYKEGGYKLEITCNYDLHRMCNVYVFDSAKDRDDVERALNNLLAPKSRGIDYD